MRIAHIASASSVISKDSHGKERLIYFLAKKQQSEGHQVTIIASSGRVDGCNLVSFTKPVKLRNNYLLNWLLARISESQHYHKSFQWLKSSYDVIHCHTTEEGPGFSFFARSPCLVTLHGTAHTRLLPYIVTKIYAIPRNTKLVALCKSAYLKQKRFYGSDLIGYVYSGIDTSMFPFVSHPRKLHEIELCFLGRIVPEKGVQVAIKVADELYESDYDVHLKIIGRLDQDRGKYFTEIARLVGRRSYVSMKVNADTSEIARYLGDSDALLFPILWEEPFGLAMIEPMSCGTPVLAFPRGSVPEIVQNGLNGFICKDINDMINAALKVSEIDRKKCREIVEKKFSVESMCSSYMLAYERVIDKT